MTNFEHLFISYYEKPVSNRFYYNRYFKYMRLRVKPNDAKFIKLSRRVDPIGKVKLLVLLKTNPIKLRAFK